MDHRRVRRLPKMRAYEGNPPSQGLHSENSVTHPLAVTPAFAGMTKGRPIP